MRTLTLAFALAVLIAPAASAALVADYQLQNTYADTLGHVALTPVGSPAFATETVNGAPRRVVQFPQDSGLLLTPTTGVISNTTYSVAILLRFDSLSSGNGYVRVIDPSNHTTDSGLYFHSTDSGATAALSYFLGTDHPGPTVVNANQYVQVVFTRDAAGQVTGYVHGVQQFQLNDTGSSAIVGNNLYFVLDNTNENGSGAIARIQLFDTTLTPSQAAALNLFAINVPALSNALLTALAVLLAAVALFRLRG